MLKLSPKYADACAFIFESARELGGRAYFVGGCVRDALFGATPKDFDIEVYGLSPRILEEMLARKFRVEKVGKSFGVWILKGYDIDVSIPRRERKTGEGHRAFDIECEPEPVGGGACARRDFTINAVLYDPLDGKIVDPYGGESDLRRGVLRHTSDRFSEDPLRVLRAMQFSARFSMEVAPETVELCSKIPFENRRLSAFREWKNCFEGAQISRGVNFLRDCGWLKYFPELAATSGARRTRTGTPRATSTRTRALRSTRTRRLERATSGRTWSWGLPCSATTLANRFARHSATTGKSTRTGTTFWA